MMTRPDEFIKLAERSLEEIDKDFGDYPGYRAAQAKGTLCRGMFTAGGQAAALTRALHFQPKAVTPVTVRFSNFTANPMRRDGTLDIRGMATGFHLPDGEQTDITALRMPRFFVGTARHFVRWQYAMKRNRFSDLPAPRMRALLYAIRGPRKGLPRSYGIRQMKPLCRIPTYAACRYESLHAFKWVDRGDQPCYVRYAWVPEVPEERWRWWQRRWWQAPRRDADYLRTELEERLERGPIRFQLEVQVAEGKDRVHDASAKWSKQGRRIPIGTLELTEMGSWDAFAEKPLRFDPTRMTDGIELPDEDDLLLLRKHVYALSAQRRSDPGDRKPQEGDKQGDGYSGAVPIPPIYPGRRGALDPDKKVHVNGVDICYEASTVSGGRPLLLIMGFACAMTWWHRDFLDMLEQKGFDVIRFDNRDSGRSSRNTVKVSKLRGLLFPRGVAPYTIDTMADDAAGLLEALDVPAAHVMGVSLGGMVAQALAIRHPHRVLSLTSINSTPNTRKWPPSRWPTMRVTWRLMKPQPKKSEQKWIEYSMPLWRRLNARHFRFEEDHVRRLLRVAWSWGGGVDPQADFRQMLAMLAASDRTPGLQEMQKPAVVIHGTGDPLIRPTGGNDTFEAIEGAKLLLIDGMGHYTPRQTWPVIVDAIDDVAAHAERHAAETAESADRRRLIHVRDDPDS